MVDWATVGTVGGSCLAGLALLGSWVSSQRKAISTEINKGLLDLGALLSERLATKDQMSQLTTRVAVLEATRNDVEGTGGPGAT